MGHTCFFPKNQLKDKISAFGRTKKAYILKFIHIEVTIGGIFTLNFLGDIFE